MKKEYFHMSITPGVILQIAREQKKPSPHGKEKTWKNTSRLIRIFMTTAEWRKAMNGLKEEGYDHEIIVSDRDDWEDL